MANFKPGDVLTEKDILTHFGESTLVHLEDLDKVQKRINGEFRMIVKIGKGQYRIANSAFQNGVDRARREIGKQILNSSKPDLSQYDIYADRPDMAIVLYKARTDKVPRFLGVDKKSGRWKTGDSKYDFPPGVKI